MKNYKPTQFLHFHLTNNYWEYASFWENTGEKIQYPTLFYSRLESLYFAIYLPSPTGIFLQIDPGCSRHLPPNPWLLVLCCLWKKKKPTLQFYPHGQHPTLIRFYFSQHISNNTLKMVLLMHKHIQADTNKAKGPIQRA